MQDLDARPVVWLFPTSLARFFACLSAKIRVGNIFGTDTRELTANARSIKVLQLDEVGPTLKLEALGFAL